MHFDAGIPTAAGDFNVMFGDWGGGNRLSDGQVEFARAADGVNWVVTLPEPLIGDPDCFTGVVPARIGFFHHQVVTDGATWGRIPVLGTTLFESAACASVQDSDGSIAHELGHNFNLRHGGFANAADGEVNCKMNYGSIMSYPNQRNVTPFAPGYSPGRFQNIVVNGFAMNEVSGLGASDVGTIGVFGAAGAMARGFLDLMTFPSGIDWNMDGRIQAGPVRAPANWASTTCAAPYLRGNWNLMIRGRIEDASLLSTAALPVMTVAEASAATPQIFGAGQKPASSVLANAQLLVGSGNAGSCQQPGLGACTLWSQRQAVDLSNFRPQSQLAVAGPLIAYRDSGKLWYVLRGKTSTGWGAPGFLSSGIVGDPAAIEVNGRVKVYAVDSAGFLRRWEFDEASRTWSVYGEADFWEDGTFVRSTFGVGVAHGAVRPAGQGVFAAIPNVNRTVAANQISVEFARHTSAFFTQTITVPAHSIPNLNFTAPAYTYTKTVKQDRWARFPAPPIAGGFSKPNLVYAPFDVSVPDDGRFYMTWVQGGTGFQSTTAFIGFTQGNDQSAGATSRRLQWMGNQVTPFADPDNQSRDLRLGVGLGRFGSSVAGVASELSGRSHYFPAADGIINADLHDFPDFQLVRHNLPCSVHGESCDESP